MHKCSVSLITQESQTVPNHITVHGQVDPEHSAISTEESENAQPHPQSTQQDSAEKYNFCSQWVRHGSKYLRKSAILFAQSQTNPSHTNCMALSWRIKISENCNVISTAQKSQTMPNQTSRWIQDCGPPLLPKTWCRCESSIQGPFM